MRVFVLTALVGVIAAASPVMAGPPDAQTIIQRMKAVLEPERPSTRKIVLAMLAADGSTTEWTARQARKRLPDGSRILTVILEPDDVRGVGLLIREHKDHPDEQWMYLPLIRRVRKMAPVGAYESFLGTDFTLADLGFVNLRDRKFSLLGEETFAERPAYKVQEVLAGRQYYYSRIVSWIAKDTMLPLRRDYYDVANELWKTELYQDAAVINGVPTVLRIHMEDKQQNTSTELRVSEVQYDAAVPDDLFDAQHLPEASKHPLWAPSRP
jgi:Outer membrane lipoprotein-sorting protein